MENDTGKYLKSGIKFLSEGNKEKALEQFNVALNILKDNARTNDIVESTKVKRQIASLELAIKKSSTRGE
jgi:hypothetical protein